MEDGMDELNNSVGFLLKTMLSRDEKKRRIKPNQNHIAQFNFSALEDSSDDEDFKLPDNVDSDDSVPITSEDDDGDDEDEEEDEGSDSDSVDIIAPLPKEETPIQAPTPTDDTETRKLKVLICSVCLGGNSVEDDEIVECDNCGVSVHEGCYGVCETQSVASTISSASTEPWFCDACKAGCNPACELCPNSGGIYKETDAGKWVHIVCALYTPGVAFGDVDQLSPVTLFEMRYEKWGSKECTLCEDARFSRTGVCISCDAGMCRAHFHATCAQREGLLSEASPDVDIADPFYAYCKQHAERSSMRTKRRNFLALQSATRPRKSLLPRPEDSNQEQLRIHRKLSRHRLKFSNGRIDWQPSWVPEVKMKRMLLSSPSATRRLLRKAELLGICESTSSNVPVPQDIRRRWHIPPALSVDFISYYLDRNHRMISMATQQQDLKAHRGNLQNTERELRLKYERLVAAVDAAREKSRRLKQIGEKLWQSLNGISTKPLSIPEMFKLKHEQTSIKESDKPTVVSPPRAVIHKCSRCNKTSDQHMLAKCDKCKKHSHLGCLDPPLTRLPKKTKLYGWYCSECVSSDSDGSGMCRLATTSPRRTREVRKPPAKFSPLVAISDRSKRSRQRKPSAKKIASDESMALASRVKSNDGITMSEPAEKKPRIEMRDNECAECGLSSADVTECDGCYLWFHPKCLKPPLSQSPKKAGKIWYCHLCESSDASSDEDDSGPIEIMSSSEDADVIEILPDGRSRPAHISQAASLAKVTPELAKPQKPSLRKLEDVLLESDQTRKTFRKTTSPRKTFPEFSNYGAINSHLPDLRSASVILEKLDCEGIRTMKQNGGQPGRNISNTGDSSLLKAANGDVPIKFIKKDISPSKKLDSLTKKRKTLSVNGCKSKCDTSSKVTSTSNSLSNGVKHQS